MEPLFFKAENIPLERKIATLYRAASMEPLFFKAENAGSKLALVRASRASMEPLFFEAENGASIAESDQD